MDTSLKTSSGAKNLSDSEKNESFVIIFSETYSSKKVVNFAFNDNKNDLHHEKGHKIFKLFLFLKLFSSHISNFKSFNLRTLKTKITRKLPFEE